MKSKLTFLILAFTQILFAQNFTESQQATPFKDYKISTFAFADVDGDDDPDVLVTGKVSDARFTKLYTNDGTGTFSEKVGNVFDGVTHSSIAFADVDGDNDSDVIIMGQSADTVNMNGISSKTLITKLYTNDGSGLFSEVKNTPFDSVYMGSIAFADVDGDDDPDVLITGRRNEAPVISKLYINDGTGIFTEMIGTPFDDVSDGSIAFADVDDDDDQDVLITGIKGGITRISKLYINDGKGKYTVALDTPFEGVFQSSIAFADVDGDDDQDVLITGQNASLFRSSRLYINDGSGKFTEMMGTPFVGVAFSSIAFADVDGDDDSDVLITGRNFENSRKSKLYINDGKGTFSEMMGTPFEDLASYFIAFADVDGDADQDFLITGFNNPGRITKLYINNGELTSRYDFRTSLIFDILPFPNPSSSENIYLNYDAVDNGDISISIYDLNGVLLKQQREFSILGQQTFIVNITSIPKGKYFMELQDGKRKGSAKFIVN